MVSKSLWVVSRLIHNIQLDRSVSKTPRFKKFSISIIPTSRIAEEQISFWMFERRFYLTTTVSSGFINIHNDGDFFFFFLGHLSTSLDVNSINVRINFNPSPMSNGKLHNQQPSDYPTNLFCRKSFHSGSCRLFNILTSTCYVTRFHQFRSVSRSDNRETGNCY